MGLNKISSKVDHFLLCKKEEFQVRRTCPVSKTKSYGLFSPLKKPPQIVDMSLEQTVDNLEIRYANAVTFVGTSNTMIDTTTGRIQTKGIQHNSNVITDVSGPHGRVAPTLKKYPEIIFDDTSKMDMGEGGTTGGLIFKQAGYTITASSTHPTNGRVPYRAFNGDHTTGWICASSSWDSVTNVYQGGRGIGGYDGEWIKLELPHKIKVETMYIEADLNSGRRPLTGKLLGSDDDSVWEIIKDLTSIPNQNRNTLNIGSTVAYKYIAFLTETIPNGHDTVWIDEIEYYGYEEYTPAGDHSVDTTIMSRFNNPQLTGVQVLVDGATEVGTNQISGGPDPSGNQSTYVTDGKYWTLNGTLTSNLSVEANTFLEGDQPHAVSVWFNSSNLEANVSNTCVFSISDQEKSDSVNLDLQSNTWHNLTYAYQGEGGSRVTYLDGRKVAEDQAEDTFGEYPPFAMTGYSQGGYVVSASSEYSSTYQQWEPYGEGGTEAPDSWISGPTQNYFGTGTGATGEAYTSGVNVADTTVIDGVTTYGEWNQVEFPEKLHLSSVALNGINSADAARYPKDAIVCASIDGITWTSIGSWTGEVNRAEANIKHYILNSTKAFKYVRIVVTKISTGYDGLTMMSRVRYYGHRENDLVRLPDPTNVLKYPHVALTGPGQRGYAHTGSSEHSSSTFAGYLGIQNAYIFDNDPATFWHAETNDGTNNQRYNGTDYLYTGIHTLGGVNGEWLKLQLPHKIILSKVHLRARSGQETQAPEDFSIIGSNNDSTWYPIQSFTGESPQDDGTSYYNITSNPTEYKYLAIVIQRLVGTSAASLATLEFYGTGVDSIPIQIGGGNIDKVANFRVYDTFIGEDQALEIWDAQKDAFGRAKSSMTLQKGRLGIGTTEPEGRLAVLDEPHGLEEFPPRAMTAEETYMEGHGVFKATSGTNDGSNFAYRAFNKISFENGWHPSSTDDGRYTNSLYLGSLSNGGYSGDWIRLDTPYKIKLNETVLYHRDHDTLYNRMPKKGVILGSNDNGKSWELVHSWDNETYQYFKEKRFMVNSNSYFQSFILVIQELETTETSEPVNIGEWRLFGTREQGQSVLHDGQLTLTKSLTVPRIGPALDADDTPRRDRLVVEYNTSTNPTFEGAVRDTSGRGLDGVFTTGAGYNANEKALTFNGATTSGITVGGATGVGGDKPFSIGLWFNMTSYTSGGANSLVTFGNPDTRAQLLLTIEQSTGIIYAQFFGASVSIPISGGVQLGNWYHLVLSYPGGGHLNMSLYSNGVKGTNTEYGGNTTALIPENAAIEIGRYASSGNPGFNGKMSSFKFYDTALTAEEVKKLYDMGRCDEGHHVVNFSKTRVGIGLGDGETPRGALDVRGGVAGPFHTFLTGDITTTSSSPTSSAYSPLVSYTFDVPKEYNSYGNANLEVFGQVKWSGECPDPWNTNFSLRLYYGSGLTSYIGSAQVSGGSNSKGCGMIAVSHHGDNNSTLDSAIASSKFLIPNCLVSPGSQLKLEILHSQGAGSGTVYTNRTTGATTTDYNYERGTTNFFMALKVV